MNKVILENTLLSFFFQNNFCFKSLEVRKLGTYAAIQNSVVICVVETKHNCRAK